MKSKNLQPDEPGTPVYRCRLCGVAFFKLDKKIPPKTLRLFLTNPPSVVAIEDVPREILHPCDGGGCGIGTIIGVVPDEVLQANIAPPGLRIEDDDDEPTDPEGVLN